MRIVIVIMAACVLASCASKAPADPRVSQVTSGTSRTHSSFDQYTKFQGPEHALQGAKGYALFRSWAEDARWPRHQLYVHVIHDGRTKEFNSASLPGGEIMEIKPIDTGSTCAVPAADCPNYEDIGIWIDAKELKKAAKAGGMTFRLNAKRGEAVVVEMPSWYLKGYLNAVR